MQKPYSWIISSKSDGHPSTRWNSNRIPLHRIHEVEFIRILFRVKVSQTLPHREEVGSMQMDRVILRENHAGALQHHLHRRIVRQSVQSRPPHRPQILRLLHAGVVVRRRRLPGEVVAENAADFEEMRVEERDLRHVEGDVVDVPHHSEAEGVGAGAAVLDAEADREEQRVVGLEGDFGRVGGGVEGAEGVCEGGGVVRRAVCEDSGGGCWGSGVDEGGGGGCVVYPGRGILVRGGGDLVPVEEVKILKWMIMLKVVFTGYLAVS